VTGFGSGHVVVEGGDDLLVAVVRSLPAAAADRPVLRVVDEAGASSALLSALDGARLLVHATAERAVVDRLCDDLRRLARVDLVDTSSRVPGPRPSAGGPPPLPESGAELLAALAEGRTLGQAAVALGLSRRTADRRLAATRDALGARSTAEAVARWAAEPVWSDGPSGGTESES
jgi:DNA-binding NarL/FixJ family response regulator